MRIVDASATIAAASENEMIAAEKTRVTFFVFTCTTRDHSFLHMNDLHEREMSCCCREDSVHDVDPHRIVPLQSNAGEVFSDLMASEIGCLYLHRFMTERLTEHHLTFFCHIDDYFHRWKRQSVVLPPLSHNDAFLNVSDVSVSAHSVSVAPVISPTYARIANSLLETSSETRSESVILNIPLWVMPSLAISSKVFFLFFFFFRSNLGPKTTRDFHEMLGGLKYVQDWC